MTPRLKRAGIAVVLAGCLWPAVSDGVRALGRFYIGEIPRAVPVLPEWSTPDGGDWVLPAKVRAMLALLRQNGIQEFRYSPAIERDPEAFQRLTEGAYPIRVTERARHWLFLTDDHPGPGCRVIATNEEAILADCN